MPRIVILGAGVAGLTAAAELRRQLGRRAEITMVSESGHFALGPTLSRVPFERRTDRDGFAIAPALQRFGITFRQAGVECIDPIRREVTAAGDAIPYDYLLITTGPRAASMDVAGVGGQFRIAQSVHNEQAAMEAGEALRRYLEQPGPAVIGLAPGAAYQLAAYEFVLWLDYTLRQRGQRDHATITFVTPESHLGHLGTDAPGAEKLLARRFAKRGISVYTSAVIERVDRDAVVLQGGIRLPSTFSLVLPAFSGVPPVWQAWGLTDAHGFVPVDGEYRHRTFPEIFAAGVAARLSLKASTATAVPKTGYIAAAMGRAAARSIAAAIDWKVPKQRTLPRMLDFRILDGGDTGLLLVSGVLGRPLRLALPLPGRSAHRIKGLLSRYILWKLRTGRTYLP
jgi:sulfide:quinone oxidoreductase